MFLFIKEWYNISGIEKTELKPFMLMILVLDTTDLVYM